MSSVGGFDLVENEIAVIEIASFTMTRRATVSSGSKANARAIAVLDKFYMYLCPHAFK
jgi:hypothetical protein